MSKIKTGLLPMYVKLYDDTWPEMRRRVDEFHRKIASGLQERQLDVVNVPMCRIKPEFDAAVKKFEEDGAAAIITLHLAYSPSLESSEVLASTKLPLIVLDTTPTYEYGPLTDPGELLYNHGIHGVQDMCCMLRRNGKKFTIVCGHWENPDVLDRVAANARAAKMAVNMRAAKVGRIGGSFEGMGDFAIPESILHETIGIQTVEYDSEEGRKLLESITKKEMEEEIIADREKFQAEDIEENVHILSIRTGLAIRKWIRNNKLTAFTANFMDIRKDTGMPCMPFLEASKAMAGGIGYAGEGDILTAAFLGAVLSVYPQASFTEMFCPDWKNNSIFLSHMGEMNTDLAVQKPRLAEKDFPFTDAENPVAAYGRFRGGKAVFANVAPGPENSYTLIVSDIEMLDVEGEDRMRDSIHGWFRPGTGIAEFLEAYGRHGGTHHGVLIYGDVSDELCMFGGYMGWKVIRL